MESRRKVARVGPHPIFTPLLLQLLSSSLVCFECQLLLFMTLARVVSGVSEFPFLFHVFRMSVLYFSPNLHAVVPGGPETKQKSKIL